MVQWAACRWDEMVFSIFVMLAQVGLEAYILGTLFHYVVKKDAKLEEFRSVIPKLSTCIKAIACKPVNYMAARITSKHVCMINDCVSGRHLSIHCCAKMHLQKRFSTDSVHPWCFC